MNFICCTIINNRYLICERYQCYKPKNSDDTNVKKFWKISKQLECTHKEKLQETITISGQHLTDAWDLNEFNENFLKIRVNYLHSKTELINLVTN